jgi:hypothetical protein
MIYFRASGLNSPFILDGVQPASDVFLNRKAQFPLKSMNRGSRLQGKPYVFAPRYNVFFFREF